MPPNLSRHAAPSGPSADTALALAPDWPEIGRECIAIFLTEMLQTGYLIIP